MRWFLRNKMNITRRQPTTAAQKLPDDWEEQVYFFSLRLAVLVSLYEIPMDLVVNSDQTGIQLVPSGKKTWTFKGSKDVSVIGNEDGRQITGIYIFFVKFCDNSNFCLILAMVSSTPSGNMLPLQLIFTGSESSTRALPDTNSVSQLIKDGWHLTQTPTHWSTMRTMKDFVKKILVPFYEFHFERLNITLEQRKAVWILDCWAVHKSKEFRNFLSSNYPWIFLIYVPASCTGKAQPQDVSLQKPLKTYFTNCFDAWATKEIVDQ